MLKLGLTSVTFRSLTVDEIIDCCKKCGLSAIEWGSDVHCPPGDIPTAEAVAEKMRKAQLAVSSYGSYYRLSGGESISPYLEAAAALGAPHIRIWSGQKSYAEATPAEYAAMICEAKRCCREAEKYKIEIAFEYHGGTLTDTRENALRVMRDIDEPNLGMYFQYDPLVSLEENFAALYAFMPYLKTVHVFNVDNKFNRYSLGEAESRKMWGEFIRILNKSKAEPYLLFEFLREEIFEGLSREAEIMQSILKDYGDAENG